MQPPQKSAPTQQAKTRVVVAAKSASEVVSNQPKQEVTAVQKKAEEKKKLLEAIKQKAMLSLKKSTANLPKPPEPTGQAAQGQGKGQQAPQP